MRNPFKSFIALGSALKTLRTLNAISLFTVPEELIFSNDDEMFEYFDSKIGSESEASIEKNICRALIATVFQQTSISEDEKAQLSFDMCGDMLQSLRGAKATYKYATKDITVNEYNKLTETNYLVQTYIKIKKQKQEEEAKRKYNENRVKTAISIGYSVATFGTYGAARLVGSLFPKSVGEPILKVTNKLRDYTYDGLKYAAEKIKESKIGQKVTAFVGKVKETKTFKILRNTYNRIRQRN